MRRVRSEGTGILVFHDIGIWTYRDVCMNAFNNRDLHVWERGTCSNTWCTYGGYKVRVIHTKDADQQRGIIVDLWA